MRPRQGENMHKSSNSNKLRWVARTGRPLQAPCLSGAGAGQNGRFQKRTPVMVGTGVEEVRA